MTFDDAGACVQYRIPCRYHQHHSVTCRSWIKKKKISRPFFAEEKTRKRVQLEMLEGWCWTIRFFGQKRYKNIDQFKYNAVEERRQVFVWIRNEFQSNSQFNWRRWMTSLYVWCVVCVCVWLAILGLTRADHYQMFKFGLVLKAIDLILYENCQSQTASINKRQ